MHGKTHIEAVLEQSLMIAKTLDVNLDIVYTVACYHDMGLVRGKKNHELNSGKFLIEDQHLKTFFTEEERIIMKEAVEDHRGSRKEPPRNPYGKIVSDADRDTDLEILAIRQLPTSIKQCPEFHTFEEHFENCYEYMKARSENFKFNLRCEHPTMRERLDSFAQQFFDKEYTKTVYLTARTYYEKNGLLDKIRNSPYE